MASTDIKLPELAEAGAPGTGRDAMHSALSVAGRRELRRRPSVGGSTLFWSAKRGFDLTGSLAAMPVVAAIALVLLILNPVWNRGPLFYWQRRMGRDCVPFWAVKFRTMRPADAIRRGAEDPLEIDRITPLGAWLRRTRIDELPQIANVILGQMSLIGPRPDFLDHARVYLVSVPGYRARHAVRPGISGLAQVRLGYAEGAEMTRLKTRKDLAYIRHAGWRTEIAVLLRTVRVVATGFGAR